MSWSSTFCHLFCGSEAELEAQLKQANPKGRSLEFCTRWRIDPPVTDIRPQGAFYEARMSLSYGGQTLDSGPFRAASKKAAEQLAAQALLGLASLRKAFQPALRGLGN